MGYSPCSHKELDTTEQLTLPSPGHMVAPTSILKAHVNHEIHGLLRDGSLK